MLNNNYNEVNLKDGKKVKVYRIDNDINGNPRYVLHFLQLDISLKDYQEKSFSQYGLKKYRGKNFGGGLVIQSYNCESDLNHIIKRLKDDKMI